ncbi:MAG: hypothetical protein ABR874_04300 [Candidatus Sulfotelmatobacter sp.]|jgi:hypothetical protein
MGRYLPGVGLGIILFSVAAVFGQTGQSVPTPTSFSTSAMAVDSPIQPVNESEDTALDPASLVPDLPPLPRQKASLIGGVAEKLDRVRDEMTVHVFGGGKMKISFDARTSIYRGASLVSTSDIHQGDHVYVDTILDGSTVFAHSIRLKAATSSGESQGVVIGYRSDRNELLLRDALSPETLKIRVSSQTQVTEGDHASSIGALTPGTLVAVKFGAMGKAGDVAREVSVLAAPGGHFTFAGRVTGLDLRLGLLVITSSTDHKTYEIYLDPANVAFDDTLRPGVDVTADTNFDGTRYVARSLSVNAH